MHFCKTHDLQPSEIAFFYDDILDLSLAKMVGLRVMIGRESNPLLQDYAIRNNLADYITACDGGANGLREASEMFTGLSGNYDEMLETRIEHGEAYKRYLALRNRLETDIFVNENGDVVRREEL